jgi:hypothetical protein
MTAAVLRSAIKDTLCSVVLRINMADMKDRYWTLSWIASIYRLFSKNFPLRLTSTKIMQCGDGRDCRLLSQMKREVRKFLWQFKAFIMQKALTSDNHYVSGRISYLIIGAHSAFYTMCTGSFPGVKRTRRGANHPKPSSAVDNEY